MSILDFFKDDSGTLSSMRLTMLFCVLNAIALSWAGVLKGIDVMSTVILFLSYGLGGKLLQGVTENQNGKGKTNDASGNQKTD